MILSAVTLPRGIDAGAKLVQCPEVAHVRSKNAAGLHQHDSSLLAFESAADVFAD